MRTIATTAVCTMLLASTAFAARESFYFYLSDTGTNISTFSSSRNTKININDPWTLKITSITCSGYGIRFAPAKVKDSSIIACRQSAVWRNTTGYGLVQFASGASAQPHNNMHRNNATTLAFLCFNLFINTFLPLSSLWGYRFND